MGNDDFGYSGKGERVMLPHGWMATMRNDQRRIDRDGEVRMSRPERSVTPEMVRVTASNLDSMLGDDVDFRERISLIEQALLSAIADERERCANLTPNGLNILASAMPHEVWQKYQDAIRSGEAAERG